MLAPDSLARSLRELPALPAVVTDILNTMGREDAGIDDLAHKLSSDQALTAKMLRLANSSFYGVPRKVMSVQDAISILGLRAVRSVVVAAAVTGSFKPEWCSGFDFHAFWRHSIGTAMCAQGLAREIGSDPDAAFTAGLLHDIGQLGLAVFSGRDYDAARRYQIENGCLAHEAEQAVLGVDHGHIGDRIAEQWKLSPVLIDAVRHHHDPVESAEPSLGALVHVADNVAHALGLSRVEDEMVPPMNLVVWSSMRVGEPACHALFQQVEQQFDALCQALLV
jgi:putative nucleotidyltransferase with HDIG domain